MSDLSKDPIAYVTSEAKEKVEHLRDLRVRLKSGEYTGTDIMHAWIVLGEYADALERTASEPEAAPAFEPWTLVTDGCVVGIFMDQQSYPANCFPRPSHRSVIARGSRSGLFLTARDTNTLRRPRWDELKSMCIHGTINPAKCDMEDSRCDQTGGAGAATPPPVVQGPCPNCGAKWASVELSSSQPPRAELPTPINHELWRYLHDEHGLTLLQSELDEILRHAPPPGEKCGVCDGSREVIKNDSGGDPAHDYSVPCPECTAGETSGSGDA